MARAIKIAHIHVWDKKNKGDVAIVMAVQELLRQGLGPVEINDFPVEVLKKFDANLIKNINSHDLVIIGGGGIFYNYFLPFDKTVIGSVRAPIVLFGVGYIREIGGRKLNRRAKDSVAFLARKAALVGVRDYYTKRFLLANGIRAAKIKLVGDPAIVLTEKKPTDFPLRPGVKIGFNLNYSGWLGFGRWKQDIIKAYRQVAEYFVKTKKASCYYLLHHPDERNIISQLTIADLQIIDLPPRQQKYIYGQLDLVIGMMLHSCVMACGAGTPEINVAYDLRNKNFARYIGCPELFITLEKLSSNELLRQAQKVFVQASAYRRRFASVRNRVYKEQAEFILQINKMLCRKKS
ncbi:MAG: polysaccharide pyruvyl transferase family protein [Planctomycetes bacterium]|jgi:polysaccharide pyruvyl transferase WcaK-like protein|nr:polysaccharide pyruvyl transferase family protein [Planctomycetota bacterium]